MMSPLCWVTGGGNQKNTTSVSPATAIKKQSGNTDGTKATTLHWHYNYNATLDIHLAT